jgi:hypothetical protein
MAVLCVNFAKMSKGTAIVRILGRGCDSSSRRESEEGEGKKKSLDISLFVRL